MHDEDDPLDHLRNEMGTGDIPLHELDNWTGVEELLEEYRGAHTQARVLMFSDEFRKKRADEGSAPSDGLITLPEHLGSVLAVLVIRDRSTIPTSAFHWTLTIPPHRKLRRTELAEQAVVHAARILASENETEIGEQIRGLEDTAMALVHHQDEIEDEFIKGAFD